MNEQLTGTVETIGDDEHGPRIIIRTTEDKILNAGNMLYKEVGVTIQSATVDREGREAIFVVEVEDIARSENLPNGFKDSERTDRAEIMLRGIIAEQAQRITALESDNARLRNVIIEANRKETQY